MTIVCVHWYSVRCTRPRRLPKRRARSRWLPKRRARSIRLSRAMFHLIPRLLGWLLMLPGVSRRGGTGVRIAHRRGPRGRHGCGMAGRPGRLGGILPCWLRAVIVCHAPDCTVWHCSSDTCTILRSPRQIVINSRRRRSTRRPRPSRPRRRSRVRIFRGRGPPGVIGRGPRRSTGRGWPRAPHC